MTIKEYFEALKKDADLEELEEIKDLEDYIRYLYNNDYDRFVMWAIEEDLEIK